MTPIFLISYNRLTVLKRMIERLTEMGQRHVVVVDNASDYRPLLDYYDQMKGDIDIIKMERNYGHEVMKTIWNSNRWRARYALEMRNYIYSDPDVVPAEKCPADFAEKFSAALEKYGPGVVKIGFGLKIDDLPDSFIAKEKLIAWEGQFWADPIEDGDLGMTLYRAPIDTTFAMQKAGTSPGYSYRVNSIRTGPPYVARHLPWYIDTENLSEEDLNYMRTASEFDTHFPGRYLEGKQ